VILKDERAGLEHRLGEGGARLGRDPDLDIIFPEHEDVVSAIHCRVTFRDGGWWLEDLGSTNGTWLEGKRISAPAKLTTGQRFSLGQRGPVLKVSIPGQVARTMAEPAEALTGGPLVRLRRVKGGDDLIGAGAEVVLGRASACTIPLRTVADTVVSKRHAVIALDEKGAATVLDLGSRNGTFLNGKPVRARTTIALGDRIMLGWEGPLFEVRALGSAAMPDGAGAPYHPRGGPPKTLSGMMAVAEEQARGPTGMRRGVFVRTLARQLATESSLAFRLVTLVVLLALAAAVVAVSRTAAERTARAEAQLNAEQVVTTQLLAEQQRSRDEIARLESSLRAARRAAVSRAVLDSLERRLREAEAAAVPPPVAAAPGGAPHDFTDVARENGGAVGLVVARFPAGDSVMGSGFAITSSGVFVTNRHVVLDDTRGSARAITVIMAETNTALPADVVVISTILGQDIAILRIRGFHGPAVHAIDWAGRGATQGAPAAVLGFPFGTQLALTPGGYVHTSLFGGYISQSTGEWIRFSGNTYSGVSGSPVFNVQGEVIAVHFGAPREGTGLGISVPMSKVRRWLPPEVRLELGL
jgi:pSer/pThr/pTyr-binding forkhead associated (FHA) protein/S1-C subfamily serine protease